MPIFSTLSAFDPTKLLTDHGEEIDVNDKDFQCILKCLEKIPDNAYPSTDNSERRLEAIEPKMKNSNGN